VISGGSTLADSKKDTCFFEAFTNVPTWSNEKNQKGARRSRTQRLGRKAKVVITAFLVIVIVLSLYVTIDHSAFSSNKDLSALDSPQPASNPLDEVTKALQDAGDAISESIGPHKGPIESAQTMNSTVWKKVGAPAWNYFKPGKGVNSHTGLPNSGLSYPYFTDWDLGVYIQAVIDASKLGYIDKTGNWGFNVRIEKVLTFLETRELNNYTYPFWFYQANDGKVFHENSDSADFVVDVADTGRLLVALNNLRTYSPSYTTRIDNLVYNVNSVRSDYEALVPSIEKESLTSTSVYTYYVACGFASFWPQALSDAPSNILNNIDASGTVNLNGVTLPKASITGDIMFCLLFETPQDSRVTTLARQVYLAHEAYYQATGKYRAFGEGSAMSDEWQWEWVTLPDGRKWTVLNGAGDEVTSSPMVYTKVAFSFLAVYNTAYAKNMSAYIEHAVYDIFANDYGYAEGIDENKDVIGNMGSNTNGLILGAAQYVVGQSGG
jgi:hypothetical protein